METSHKGHRTLCIPAPRRPAQVLFLILIFFLGAAAFAHHGVADYDEQHLRTLSGTVSRFELENPHSRILLDVKDEKGKTVAWAIETLTPAKLVRAGWTKDSLKPGNQITVTVDPAKNGSPAGFLRKLVFADGQELKMFPHPQ